MLSLAPTFNVELPGEAGSQPGTTAPLSRSAASATFTRSWGSEGIVSVGSGTVLDALQALKHQCVQGP